ncbi:hypothetical protein HK099_002511, partial [Clydaea vesicula]
TLSMSSGVTPISSPSNEITSNTTSSSHDNPTSDTNSLPRHSHINPDSNIVNTSSTLSFELPPEYKPDEEISEPLPTYHQVHYNVNNFQIDNNSIHYSQQHYPTLPSNRNNRRSSSCFGFSLKFCLIVSNLLICLILILKLLYAIFNSNIGYVSVSSSFNELIQQPLFQSILCTTAVQLIIHTYTIMSLIKNSIYFIQISIHLVRFSLIIFCCVLILTDGFMLALLEAILPILFYTTLTKYTFVHIENLKSSLIVPNIEMNQA